jgi:hypothetical protein
MENCIAVGKIGCFYILGDVYNIYLWNCECENLEKTLMKNDEIKP